MADQYGHTNPEHIPFVTRFSAPGRADPIWYRDECAQQRITTEVSRLNTRIDNILAGGVTYVGKVNYISPVENPTESQKQTPTDGSTAQYYHLSTATSDTCILASTGDLFIVDNPAAPGNQEFIWNGSSWEELGFEGLGSLAYSDTASGTYNVVTGASPVHTATTTSFSGQYHNVTSASLAKQVVTGMSYDTAQIYVAGSTDGGAQLPSITVTTGNIKQVTGVTTTTISIIDGVGTLPSLSYDTGSVNGVNSVTATTISIIDGVGSLPTRASITVVTGVSFDAGSLPTGKDTTISGLVSSWSAGSLPTKAAVTVVTGVTHTPATLSVEKGSIYEITGVGGLPSWSSQTKSINHVTSVTTSNIYQITGVGSLPSLTTKTVTVSDYLTLSATDTSLAIFSPISIEGVVNTWSTGGLPTRASLTVVTAVNTQAVTVMTGATWSAGSLPTRASVTVVTDASLTGTGAVTPQTATISQITGVGTLPALTTREQTIKEFNTQGTAPSLTAETSSIYQITGVGSLPTKKAQTVVTAVTTNSFTGVTNITFDPGTLPTKKAQTVVTAVTSGNATAVTSVTFSAGKLVAFTPIDVATSVSATKETVGVTLTSSSATITVSGKYDKTTSISLVTGTATVTVEGDPRSF